MVPLEPNYPNPRIISETRDKTQKNSTPTVPKIRNQLLDFEAQKKPRKGKVLTAYITTRIVTTHKAKHELYKPAW